MTGLSDTIEAPCLGFAAIERLTDGIGMLQHSRLSVPDPAHGYCVDDNARALILMHRRPELPEALRGRWIETFANFVDRSWNPERGRFRNFMDRDGNWLEESGSKDSNGRALWSLGITVAEGDAALGAWALCLFEKAAAALSTRVPPRTMAFSILGAVAVLGRDPGHGPARMIAERFADRLAHLAMAESRAGWTWFEPCLAYDNCRLPEALLRAGRALARDDLTGRGLATLGWIEALQRGPKGDHYRWVGTEGFGRAHAPPAPYDQQPLEAQGMVEACAAAFAATGDPAWARRAERAFAWFEGANDKKTVLADPASGECYDGLTRDGANLNRGAESVLAYQLGAAAIGRLRLEAGR